MDAHDELDHGPKRSEEGVTADGTCSSRKSTIDHMQYYMRSYGAKTHVCVRSPSRIVREKERERERPPEALWELRERSGWDGGRFLPARSEILGVFLCFTESDL